MGHRGSHERDQAVRITTAPMSLAEEQAQRQRRYLIAMSIRMVCFVGAVVVGPGWLRWTLIVGAVFMPYVAVVMANAVAPRREGPALLAPSDDRGMLPPP
jgi:hypothetical protein